MLTLNTNLNNRIKDFVNTIIFILGCLACILQGLLLYARFQSRSNDEIKLRSHC